MVNFPGVFAISKCSLCETCAHRLQAVGHVLCDREIWSIQYRSPLIIPLLLCTDIQPVVPKWAYHSGIHVCRSINRWSKLSLIWSGWFASDEHSAYARYERWAGGGEAEHGVGYVKLYQIHCDQLGCISRQKWANQTNIKQPGRFFKENYILFVCLGLQQSPTMLVSRIA